MISRPSDNKGMKIDIEAMAGSAASNMKKVGEYAKRGESHFKKQDFIGGLRSIVGLLGNIEQAINAVEATTDLRADLEMPFTNLRSDIRLFRQDLEDEMRESVVAHRIANEVMEAGDYENEVSVENVVTELMSRGVFVAAGPSGMPTRRDGVFVAEPREGTVASDNSLMIRLMGEGKWMDTRRVDAGEYLRALLNLPKEASTHEIWSAG